MWGKRSDDRRIGIIAGSGDFPVLLAREAASAGQDVVVFGIEGHTDRSIERYGARTHYVGLGELGRIIGLLKETGLRRVVLAGGIPKKELYNPSMRLDEDARRVVGRTSEKGDDRLLRALEGYLWIRCGVRVVDSRVFLGRAMVPKGTLTRRAPDAGEWKDIKFGWKIAKRVGRLDIGQTVAVRQGTVIAVEAIEGTDQAILRAGALTGPGAVIVKACKPGQALRFDLPCVGPRTIESMREAGSRVLAVEAGKTIFLSRADVIAAAEETDISIVGL